MLEALSAKGTRKAPDAKTADTPAGTGIAEPCFEPDDSMLDDSPRRIGMHGFEQGRR